MPEEKDEFLDKCNFDKHKCHTYKAEIKEYTKKRAPASSLSSFQEQEREKNEKECCYNGLKENDWDQEAALKERRPFVPQGFESFLQPAKLVDIEKEWTII